MPEIKQINDTNATKLGHAKITENQRKNAKMSIDLLPLSLVEDALRRRRSKTTLSNYF